MPARLQCAAGVDRKAGALFFRSHFNVNRLFVSLLATLVRHFDRFFCELSVLGLQEEHATLQSLQLVFEEGDFKLVLVEGLIFLYDGLRLILLIQLAFRIQSFSLLLNFKMFPFRVNTLSTLWEIITVLP